MQPSNDRFVSAVRRNIAEINNAILKRRALIGLHSADSAHGLDFFRLAAHALYNDIISHALKVFERGSQSASFWYIVKTNETLAKQVAKEVDVSLDEIRRLSERLKLLRDKTHFHIDRDAIMDSTKVWAAAGITGDQVGYVLEGAWKILAGIAREVFDESYEIPDYDGSDAEKIIRAYQAAHPDAPIVL